MPWWLAFSALRCSLDPRFVEAPEAELPDFAKGLRLYEVAATISPMMPGMSTGRHGSGRGGQLCALDIDISNGPGISGEEQADG